jgi:hypothetical protein
MRFAFRLLQRRRSRIARGILEEGRILHCEFHPLRRGIIRAARGKDALEIIWHQTSHVLKATLNGVQLHIKTRKDHDALLKLALHRASKIISKNQAEIDRHLPILVGVRVKRRISVMAMRVAKAIKSSLRICDQRDANGFGHIRVFLAGAVIQLHVLEGAKLPAIQINRSNAFSTPADVRFVTRAIYLRIRQLRRSSLETHQAMAA